MVETIALLETTALKEFVDHLVLSVDLFKPEAALVVTFIVALTADLIFRKTKNIAGYIALIGFIVTFYFLYHQENIESQSIFSNMLVVDPFGQFFKYIVLITSFLVVLISFYSKELYINSRSVGEYYSIIVGMTFGMFLLSSATNLIMIYLAIEIMSISSYVLAGYTKEIKRASEASLKYVIFGAVASGIMIYGVSILYGLTGSLGLTEINTVLKGGVDSAPLAIAGIMIIAGIAYKISAVPFHFWTPDVYEGAPITVTAYLSIASKAAGFAVLIRFMKVTLIDSAPIANEAWTLLGNVDWFFVIAILSVLSMTLGNIVALWQKNIKRLLAYSSIAHAGYMLMGVVVMNDIGISAVMVYFFVYLFMNLGAFTVVMLIANKTGNEDVDEYNGMGYRAPVLSACMVIFMISLTGLPPTAGFVGKLVIFQAVLDSGYIWLAVIGVLNSVISLYYYVKIFRNMYLRDVDSTASAVEAHPFGIILVLLLVIPTLYFGIFFDSILNWAESSVAIFM